MRGVVMVGAGTFGASLAWWLARAGADVPLVDQFAPGDPRATSGGESRLIRCSHGPDAGYTASARRARRLWRGLEGGARVGAVGEVGGGGVFAPRGGRGGEDSPANVVPVVPGAEALPPLPDRIVS